MCAGGKNRNRRTDYFHGELVKDLSDPGRYQVANASGPGVARLRIAIADIEKTTPVAHVHPAMKLGRIGLGGAAMEAEVEDLSFWWADRCSC